MKTTHTPGPWKVSSLAPLNICKDNGTLIADCCNAWQSFDGEREANARLIAAAPDLLAALETLANIAAVFPNELHEKHQDIIDARAAIAKAKGEYLPILPPTFEPKHRTAQELRDAVESVSRG